MYEGEPNNLFLNEVNSRTVVKLYYICVLFMIPRERGTYMLSFVTVSVKFDKENMYWYLYKYSPLLTTSYYPTIKIFAYSNRTASNI